MATESTEQLVIDDQSVTLEASQPTGQATISQQQKVRGLTRILLFASLLSSAFLFGFDQTVTTDIQQGIAATFGSFEELHWISVSFMLGGAVSRFFWIKMYTNLDAKNIYISAIIVFALGSTLCAAAPTMSILIVGRSTCGASGTGMYIGGMKLLHQMTSNGEPSRFIGIPSLIWGIATILSPIIGDAFTLTAVGWRFSFYVNLLVCAAFTPILFKLPRMPMRMIPQLPPLQLTNWIEENDLVGKVLLSMIYVTGLIATALGGIVYDWTNYRILFLSAICGCLMIIYWIQQAPRLTRSAKPLPTPHSFESLRNPMVLFLGLTESCASISVFIPMYFIPLYFQFLEGSFVLDSSIHLLPLLASILIMIAVSGAIITRHGNTDVTPWFSGFGGLLIFTGGALIATIDKSETGLGNSKIAAIARVYAATILIGVGAGSYIQLPFTIISTEFPPSPSTIDLLSYAQLAAPATVLSLTYTFYRTTTTKCLIDLLPNIPVTQIHRFLAGGNIDLGNSSIESSGMIVERCVGSNIRKVFVLVAGAGALTVVATLPMSYMRIWPVTKRRLHSSVS